MGLKKHVPSLQAHPSAASQEGGSGEGEATGWKKPVSLSCHVEEGCPPTRIDQRLLPAGPADQLVWPITPSSKEARRQAQARLTVRLQRALEWKP